VRTKSLIAIVLVAGLAWTVAAQSLESVEAKLVEVTTEAQAVLIKNATLPRKSRLPSWVTDAMVRIAGVAESARLEVEQLIIIAGPPKTPPPSPETYYYVRTDGSNSNTGLGNSAGAAWLTINHAADNVPAGGTVRVQAGTYVEVASLGIRVIGFVMNPDTGGCTANQTIVSLTGTNTGLEFWNNTIEDTNANGLSVGTSSHVCNSCIIVGNTIQQIGRTASAGSLIVSGNDVFLGYNDINNVCYLGYQPAGLRHRAVNFYFHDLVQCLSTHPDNIYPQITTLGWSYNLMEASYTIGTPAASDNKAMHVENDTDPGIAWTDNIWRGNVAYNLGSGYYSVYSTYGGSGSTIDRFRFYNDTLVEMSQALSDAQFAQCGNLSSQFGTLSASLFNNLYVECWTEAARTAGNIRGWSADYGGSTITSNYSLLYDTRGSVTTAMSGTNQVNVNPSFVTPGSNFTLQSGSGARGVGGALTTANGSGSSSTTLTVASNTGSFFVGSNASNLPQYGGALAPGDFITVDAATAQIASISGDVITLASAISWDNADPVYFGSSATIDIGAYPYKAGGYTLSATYAIAGGTVTITPNDSSLVRFVVCYSSGVPYAVDNSSTYTCAVPSGNFEARVYPRYASSTLWAVATP
jgi:hypothetical protein